MPSDLIREWAPVRVKKTRRDKELESPALPARSAVSHDEKSLDSEIEAPFARQPLTIIQAIISASY
jgi:hypothetical protein